MDTTCKVCGSKTTQEIQTNFGLFHHCDRCDFIGKDSSAILSKKDEMDRYLKHNNTDENTGYMDYLRRFIETAVLPYAGNGSEGLDFGSGPQPILAELLTREYGYKMDIYDPYFSPDKAFEGKKYDLITATEVVEHVQNPIAEFLLLKNLMKENGLLAMMTLFHHQNPDHFKDWHYIRDKTHISFYTPKTMKYIAKKVDLKVVYTDSDRYISFALK